MRINQDSGTKKLPFNGANQDIQNIAADVTNSNF